MSLQRKCCSSNKDKLEEFEHSLGPGFLHSKVPGENQPRGREAELSSWKYTAGAVRQHFISSSSSLISVCLPPFHIALLFLLWPSRKHLCFFGSLTISPNPASQTGGCSVRTTWVVFPGQPDLHCSPPTEHSWTQNIPIHLFALTTFHWSISCLERQGEEIFLFTDKLNSVMGYPSF